MNRYKIALYVEGQTEYILMRDLLCRWYDYDGEKVGIECFSLRSDFLHEVPYPFGNRDSEVFYQIVNVGNDQSVISKMLKDALRLQNAGFQLVVGLSDMYGDNYHKTVKDRTIHEDVNRRFKEERLKIIEKSPQKEILHYHFAIMEVEAWLLGMPACLERSDSRLTVKWIHDQLGIDITSDPETTYYHPARVLNDILNSVGLQYDKHKDEIHTFTAMLTKEDFVDLMKSGKCQSFREFMGRILIE